MGPYLWFKPILKVKTFFWLLVFFIAAAKKWKRKLKLVEVVHIKAWNVSTVVPKEVIQNGGFVRFFAKIFLLVCRMITIFYWRKELVRADLSDTLNMFVKSIKNFLEAFEKRFSPKKWRFVRIFQPDFELHFFKISTFFTFPDIKSDWCVVWSRFFYWRKALG